MRKLLFTAWLLTLAPGVCLAQPAPLSGFEDHGTFLLLLNEEQIGRLEFDWKTDGHFTTKATLSFAGQTAATSLDVTPDPEGRWTEISGVSRVGLVKLRREGKNVTRTIKDKTATLTLGDNVLLFDNTAPALFSAALRAYDNGKGGKQSLPVLILPGALQTITLERKETADRSAAGRDLTLTRWIYGVPGIDIMLWSDAEGRIYLAEVPVQHAVFVREGYEALRKPPIADPVLSAAAFEVKREANVKAPMRDGVKLAIDLYRPSGVEKPPVILLRTPYKKDMLELQARFYARRGYAVAVQDCRGRFASEGVWEPFLHEARDGYDTVEWLAKQPWNNGKVGMIGASYGGWVQWWAASQKPPHLVTIIPNVAPPDPYYNIPYDHGVFFLWGSIWWADVLESAATADISGAAMSKTLDRKFGKLLASLPVIDLDKAVLGKENPYWRRWIRHQPGDDYWSPALFLDKIKGLDIPVFHQSGWYDGDGIGTKLNYARMSETGAHNQKLTIGPWAHSDQSSRKLGDRDFGTAAELDLQRDYLRWFDHWLKGVDNGIDKEPQVSVFVMGSNRWLQGARYPLPETRFQNLYFLSGGSANTSKGDGKLAWNAPPERAQPDKYTYDPGDPTPLPDYLERSEEEDKQVRSVNELKKEGEEHREKVTQARKDLLVYVTDALEKPLTIAGPLSAVLYASSSARDTDWFVTLLDLDEKGKAIPLTPLSGKLRARYRNGFRAPEFLDPGHIYEYRIDLWHTGITLPARHRLRVEISSAQFPFFSRNLNTGGNNELESKFVSARQSIYHDAKHPSHLVLPVIP